MIQDFILCYIVAILYMTIWFVAAVKKKDNSLADIAWGIGFIVLALFTYANGVIGEQQQLITGITIVWGLRLALYINYKHEGKKEDFRYKKMRDKWGDAWVLKSFINVFLLQGTLLFIISLPIIVTNLYGTAATSWVDILGLLLWMIGITIETIADLQMALFKQKKSNEGKILKTGLWRYSRHPNYFGECVVWWAIYIIAADSYFGVLTIISPIVITFLLLKVSGVVMLEKKYDGNEEYQQYKKNTSSFIPLPPKNES